MIFIGYYDDYIYIMEVPIYITTSSKAIRLMKSIIFRKYGGVQRHCLFVWGEFAFSNLSSSALGPSVMFNYFPLKKHSLLKLKYKTRYLTNGNNKLSRCYRIRLDLKNSSKASVSEVC